jgi:hypothetical protein
LNSIEDADVLHVLGRPQAPDYTALQLAHVLHKGEAPIIPHIAMRPEPYAGYRAQDGSGRAITVSDFYDVRASIIFRAYRESELLQAVHRARLFRVGSAQADLFELDGETTAPTVSERRAVRLVIHSSQPIPGLRVDELLYDEAPGVNERRAAEATARILAARDQLVREGVPVTLNALARAARADKRSVSRVLSNNKFDPTRCGPLKERVFSRGIHRAGSNPADLAPFRAPEAPPGAALTVLAGIEPNAVTGPVLYAVMEACPGTRRVGGAS